MAGQSSPCGSGWRKRRAALPPAIMTASWRGMPGLVAFDPLAIGASAVHRVYDQPGGADRLISRSTGVQHMWVNGVAARTDGADVPGVTAGRLLRG
jgi:N-acyl-D-aspartate/D-glutamate deacylase